MRLSLNYNHLRDQIHTGMFQISTYITIKQSEYSSYEADSFQKHET